MDPSWIELVIAGCGFAYVAGRATITKAIRNAIVARMNGSGLICLPCLGFWTGLLAGWAGDWPRAWSIGLGTTFFLWVWDRIEARATAQAIALRIFEESDRGEQPSEDEKTSG